MPQGVLPYNYDEEKRAEGMTGLAGLPTYLAAFHDAAQEIAGAR